MRIYIYTQDANGRRQVVYHDDPGAVDLILSTVREIYAIGDKTWLEGRIDLETGQQNEIRLITLTPAPLDLQGHIMVMSDVMEIAERLRPGETWQWLG